MLLGVLISDDNTLCLHIALQFIFTLSFDQNNRVCMVWWRGLFSPWRCGQKAEVKSLTQRFTSAKTRTPARPRFEDSFLINT